MRSKMSKVATGEIQYIGVYCKTFPFSRRWPEGKAGREFPSRRLIDSFIKQGCSLIPKSHKYSVSPDIEWQFNFSMAEYIIFQNLTYAQKHGFCVLKVLTENMINDVPYKLKHLKNVYLMALEDIPSSAWETSFSGCVLFVLDKLLECYKKKHIPNFFIPEQNHLDCFPEEDFSILITHLEFIRLFPTLSIQIIAEKYGFTYGPNMIRRVLSSMESEKTNVYHEDFHDLFWPLTNAAARAIAKIGFYDVSLDMLREAYEENLLIPQRGIGISSFCEVFVKAVAEMKQRLSRAIMIEMYDTSLGSNLSDVLKKPDLRLENCLQWSIDSMLNWIEISPDMFGDMIAISHALYECSRLEYKRRNKVIAELTIKTAIRCIKEVLFRKPLKEESLNDSNSKAEIDADQRTVKRELILYYIHLFFVSRLDFKVVPLIDYMDDIENLCNEFPEMAGIVGHMFQYLGQREKRQLYMRMFHSQCHEKGEYDHS